MLRIQKLKRPDVFFEAIEITYDNILEVLGYTELKVTVDPSTASLTYGGICYHYGDYVVRGVDNEVRGWQFIHASEIGKVIGAPIPGETKEVTWKCKK